MQGGLPCKFGLRGFRVQGGSRVWPIGKPGIVYGLYRVSLAWRGGRLAHLGARTELGCSGLCSCMATQEGLGLFINPKP